MINIFVSISFRTTLAALSASFLLSTAAFARTVESIGYENPFLSGGGISIWTEKPGDWEISDEAAPDLPRPVETCPTNSPYLCAKFSIFDFVLPKALNSKVMHWSYGGIDFKVLANLSRGPDALLVIQSKTFENRIKAQMTYNYYYSSRSGLVAFYAFKNTSGNDEHDELIAGYLLSKHSKVGLFAQ